MFRNAKPNPDEKPICLLCDGCGLVLELPLNQQTPQELRRREVELSAALTVEDGVSVRCDCNMGTLRTIGSDPEREEYTQISVA